MVDLLNRGSFAELERCAGELLEQDPSNGWLWQMMAIAQQRRGRDSLSALREAARCLPDDAVAQLNLANALARLGRYTEAGACYNHALQRRPDFLEAHVNLGEMQLEQGRADLAAESCARALAIQPDSAAAHHSMAKARLRQERLQEAVKHGRRAIALDADYAVAHNTLGIGLAKLGRFHEALGSFLTAVNLNPGLVEAQLNLAGALRSIGNLDEAETAYRRVIDGSAESAPALAGLATVLRLQRRSVECESCCRRAIDIDSKSTAALAVLAELRADTGHFAAAEELHRRILSMDSNALESLAALSHLRRMTKDDAEWRAAAELYIAAPLPPRRELTLRYALGKYCDDIADFDRAFMHYRRANELSVQCAPPHDRSALVRTVDRIISSQDRSWITRNQATGNQSERPVFIVGMLRSGTTLAEQILASHPGAFGAGELTYFATENAAAYASGAAAGTELGYEASRLHRLSAGYLELLQRLSGRQQRVVNKFPTNFFFLGLIHAVLPCARIIHMQRDPRDTCLSIYFQQFEAANTYANDLEDLAHYYGEYQRLMGHWDGILPRDAMLHVSYERLVEDPEAWSRKMVQFVGLEWDARCLDFHRTERAVVTASRWQIRQGMSKSSVGRWRNYARHLGPLAALGER